MLTLRNLKCESCGQIHDVLEALELNAPGQSTHWYTCPVNGDPVLLRIAATHDGDVALDEEILQSLIAATKTGRYMVAVFSAEGATLRLMRAARNFQTLDFPRAVQLLRENLTQEFPSPEYEMKAVKVEPSVNLFG